MPKVPDHFYAQSGVIAYRLESEKLQVLLITSNSGKRWVVPKGVIEPHLSAWKSAEQEAWEEAGVRGEVSSQCIGTYEYEKWGGTCRVQLFPLRVTDVEPDWPESHRKRRWLSCKDASEKVREPALQQLLLHFTVPESPC